MKHMKKIILSGSVVTAVVMLAVLLPFSISMLQSQAMTVISGVAGKSAVVSLASFYKLQKYEYVDDATSTNKYIGEDSTWITTSGSPFSTTGTTLYSGIVKVDLATGLWWSDRSSSTMDDNFTLTPDNNTGVPVGGSAIAFCAALATANFGGHNDWYLPTQKQLMQAYIDGSNYNLPNSGTNFWSSTESYSNPAYAWYVILNNGNTVVNTKVALAYVRCVRP
jgi:hypothetical protein